MSYMSEGHSYAETAEVFKVNSSTLLKWKSRLKESGKIETRKRRETWRKIDPDRLVKYLEEYPDAYLKEMAEEFHCSDVAILKALRRLKITRKKNHSFSGN